MNAARRSGMQAVILAGGKGTRLLPYTVVFPKPMLPLGGQPIIQIILTQLVKHGFTDIVISLGYLGDLIELYLNEKRPEGVNLRFVREQKPLGTAGALSLVEDLEEDFLVVNGDILTTLDYRAMFDFHREHRSALTVAVGVKEVCMNLGILTLDGQDRVTGIEEKPTYRFNDNMGIYVYNRSAVSFIPQNQRTDLNVLMESLIKENLPVFGYRSQGPYYWIDIGQHAEYDKANEEFEKHREVFLGKGD
jgi:NDP-sugar pyrophosphorylase family protein